MKFQTNKTYKTRFINNADNILKCKIVKRTAKTVWVSVDGEEPVRKKIKTGNRNEEICFPIGNYRNAPLLRSTKLV